MGHTRPREPALLEALASVAGAATGGGMQRVIEAIADGVPAAFGLESTVNVLDEAMDAYVVRAVTGDGAELMGTWSSRASWEELLGREHEVVPDVFYIPFNAPIDVSALGAVHTPDHGWSGPGYWHPEDLCFIRMRTSGGETLAILSVDSSTDQAIPDREAFEALGLYARVGANTMESVGQVREIAEVETEREAAALRRELHEELQVRRSLLELGNRLGAASATGATTADLFSLVMEYLDAVVPFTSLTIYGVDHDDRTVRPVFDSDESIHHQAAIDYRMSFGTGATGTAVVERQSIISNEGQIGGVAVHIPGTPEEPQHVLAVPVTIEERIGVVLTLRRPGDQAPFMPSDARRAELFAQHVTSSLLMIELAESRRLLTEQVGKLEDLNRLKDEFVANVSHELRTPLTAVIGNVMTVAGLGDMLGSEERRDLLAAAERQAKRLAELLENLLAESRLVGADPAIVPARIDVRPFLEEVAGALRFRGAGRDIKATTSGRPEIFTDRTLLYRILLNLGDNALKYSDGPIRLEAAEANGGLIFRVIDRGEGIAPVDLPRIFEQFEQLDGSSSRRVGGLGLGLHLCQKAARTLGGRIVVESEIGTGSMFTVWLPRTYVGRSAAVEVGPEDLGRQHVLPLLPD